MAGQQCPPGFIWDSLVRNCISQDLLWQTQKPFAGKRNSKCPASHHRSDNTNSNDKDDVCPHVNSKQEVFDCEMGWGRGSCKARGEPVVPLPATELGDSALVTTKTVQLVDYSHCDAP
ncbi:hypothetical protein C0J50_2311 [Silurus asotus]|uniref:Uncharacterized protein n=1 Tax=Silurus asotus TaxID=30991 RepID=A0AAD5B8N9_SILAS|nr:hypothetical protein C0J50_2311 [Silurus asotus]